MPGNFFDLSPAQTCVHPEHNPPMGLYIPPGKGYMHECPACGERSVSVSWSAVAMSAPQLPKSQTGRKTNGASDSNWDQQTA